MNVALVSVLLMPGPFRENVWMDDLSWITNVYLPALTCFTAFPAAFFSEIVKPGPTVPNSLGTVIAPVMLVATRATAAARRRTRRRMSPPFLLLYGAYAPPVSR